MEFDVKAELDAARRSVSSPERDGQPARAVALSRSYVTTLEDLWDAVANEARIPRWFLPVSGDLRRGGRYQLEGNAGGVITACDPCSRFSLTWEFCQDVSWVDVRLANDGQDRARLTLIAYRAPFGSLGRIRSGRARRGLGAGFPRAGDPCRAAVGAEAGRSRLCGFAVRQGIHRGKQQPMGTGGHLGGNGPRFRARGGKPHIRVLHR